MSKAARTALAEAASTVDGITCHPYFVQSTQPGHATIRLDRTEYPNRFGGVDHWNVVVILPQDQASAEKFIEAHVPAIVAAVGREMAVKTVQPQQLKLDGVGILPCVFINGHREQETQL
jgi:hypothetical protein